MSYKCPLCAIDADNHSLVKIKETTNIVYFYTCPANAKLYYDAPSIINHYNGVLSEIPSDKYWIWIFDSSDFGLKHFIQFRVGIELAKLISNKFSHNMYKIIIINPTNYISLTFNIVYHFLNDKLKSIIDFNTTDKNVEQVLLSLKTKTTK
jgi:hypothetical protein